MAKKKITKKKTVKKKVVKKEPILKEKVKVIKEVKPIVEEKVISHKFKSRELVEDKDGFSPNIHQIRNFNLNSNKKYQWKK